MSFTELAGRPACRYRLASRRVRRELESGTDQRTRRWSARDADGLPRRLNLDQAFDTSRARRRARRLAHLGAIEACYSVRARRTYLSQVPGRPARPPWRTSAGDPEPAGV